MDHSGCQKNTSGMLPQTTPIVDVRSDTRDIRTFVLDAEVPKATPGQFVMLWLPGTGEKPMSIACPSPLTVTVARVGPFTAALHEKSIGDHVGWRGPYGRGFALDRESPSLLVAGGCGIGPMAFLAQRASACCSNRVILCLGARTSDALPDQSLPTAARAQVRLATDDGSAGFAGYVSELARSTARELGTQCDEQPVLYACGPEPMLVALHALCHEMGLPGQFSLERYMKCGFGICGQCALDHLLVCKDGPVFHVSELDGVGDFGHFRRSPTGRRLPLR